MRERMDEGDIARGDGCIKPLECLTDFASIGVRHRNINWVKLTTRTFGAGECSV